VVPPGRLSLPLIRPPAAVATTREQRERYVGTFVLQLLSGPRDFTFFERDDQLHAQLAGQGANPLRYLGNDTWGASFDPELRIVFEVEAGAFGVQCGRGDRVDQRRSSVPAGPRRAHAYPGEPAVSGRCNPFRPGRGGDRSKRWGRSRASFGRNGLSSPGRKNRRRDVRAATVSVARSPRAPAFPGPAVTRP